MKLAESWEGRDAENTKDNGAPWQESSWTWFICTVRAFWLGWVQNSGQCPLVSSCHKLFLVLFFCKCVFMREAWSLVSSFKSSKLHVSSLWEYYFSVLSFTQNLMFFLIVGQIITLLAMIWDGGKRNTLMPQMLMEMVF